MIQDIQGKTLYDLYLLLSKECEKIRTDLTLLKKKNKFLDIRLMLKKINYISETKSNILKNKEMQMEALKNPSILSIYFKTLNEISECFVDLVNDTDIISKTESIENYKYYRNKCISTLRKLMVV